MLCGAPVRGMGALPGPDRHHRCKGRVRKTLQLPAGRQAAQLPGTASAALAAIGGLCCIPGCDLHKHEHPNTAHTSPPLQRRPGAADGVPCSSGAAPVAHIV